MDFALAARTSGLKGQRAVIFIPQVLNLASNLQSPSGLQALPMEVILLIMECLKITNSAPGVPSFTLISSIIDMIHFAMTCKATMQAAMKMKTVEHLNFCLTWENRIDLTKSRFTPKLSKKCGDCDGFWLYGDHHSRVEKWALHDDEGELFCPGNTQLTGLLPLGEPKQVRDGNGNWTKGMTKRFRKKVNEWCE